MSGAAIPALRLRFGLWLAALLAVAVVFLTQVRPQLRVDTDLLALLPVAEQDAGLSQAVRSWSDAMSRRALFLIGAPQYAEARAAAARFAEELRASGAFAQVQFEVGDQATLDPMQAPYRGGLLAPRTRELLRGGQAERLYDEALHALYAPGIAPRPLSVAEDPLNLFGGFLAQALAPPGAARWREGVLAVETPQRSDVLVAVELRDSPFATDTQERAMPAIEAARARAQAEPSVEVLGSGLILHATEATRSAQTEIGTVGTLSLIGVVLMVLLTFRSARPLLLSALVLGSGALAAVTLSHWLFGRIHLLTLVFGVGLIGVAVDYSNHFLTDQFRVAQGRWHPAQALRHVGPGIVIGMICGVLGYTALALAPLPGLRQMAVFCAIGLIAACATVLCVHPLLARASRRDDAPVLMRLSQAADRALDRLPARGWLLAALVALGVLGLWRLEFADDVRLLQSSSKALLAQEQTVRERLRSLPDSRLFVVRAATPAAVLEAEEALRVQLDRLVAENRLDGYLATSRALPSPRQQAADRALLAETVYGERGLGPRLLRQLGFDETVISRLRTTFDTAPLLAPETWLEHPGTATQRRLWLGALGDGHASVVALIGVRDVDALAALQVPGARFVDRVAEISGVLGRYRERASWLIACAWLLIGGLLVLRYGARDALRLLAVPLGAALLTLALFGLLGFTASLFNVLALFLVLGLGMDYGVFLRESQDARAPTLLALALSTLGTMLSYGLLAFSATPFIRSLGLTLTVGIGLTWLFALLAQRPARGSRD